MPFWQIYHPAGTFEDNASKQAFAEDITKIYTDLRLPAFYVVSHFYKMESNNVYVGGKTIPKTEKPFVRIVITHTGDRVPPSDAMYLRATSRLDETMKPHLLDKGYDFEYHVHETERRLWKIDSMIPPRRNTPNEQLWVKENRAVPYEGAYRGV